jgi:glutathione S-transferase
MLKFYYNGAPNPTKVALFLEEAGIPYEPIPIDTRKGEQHTPEFLAINPNAKVPAIVDGDVAMFDSNAILLYLAEKTGKFLPPKGDKQRAELLSWLLSAITRPTRSNTRSTAMPSRRYAITESSMRGSPGRNTCSATLIRSSIWTFGAGRG